MLERPYVRRYAPPRLPHAGLQEDLCLPWPGQGGQHLLDVRSHVEVRGALEVLRGDLAVEDPVEPEGAHVLTEVVPGDQVPSTALKRDAVGVREPLGHAAARGAIADPNTGAVAGCRPKGEQRGRVGGASHGERRPQRDAGPGGADAATQLVGEDPVELGQRSLHGAPLLHEAQSRGGKQADHQGQRLLVGEHQRRQPVAWPQAIAPCRSALALHGYAHLLQAGHVAPNGPDVHLQAIRYLAGGHAPVRLKELEQREQPAQRCVHEIRLLWLIGPILSYYQPTVEAMDLNPNVLMDLARLRTHEMLVAAERRRLARTAAPERHSSLEPPTELRQTPSTA